MTVTNILLREFPATALLSLSWVCGGNMCYGKTEQKSRRDTASVAAEAVPLSEGFVESYASFERDNQRNQNR